MTQEVSGRTLRSFLNWCLRRGYVQLSPLGNLDAPRRLPPRDHVLTLAEIVAIWRAAPEDDYGTVVKLCILSGQRIGQWDGFRPEYVKDDRIEWPADAMKAARKHELPLTAGVAALLHGRTRFIRQRGGRQKAALDATSGVRKWKHLDLRRSWATIAAEDLDTAPHIIEAVLAHASGTQVARTYNRAKYLKPMREALESWEAHLTRLLQKGHEQA